MNTFPGETTHVSSTWTLACRGLTAGAASIGPAAAQKQGGTLRSYIWDTPPSASIHEEATISTVVPVHGGVQQPRHLRPARRKTASNRSCRTSPRAGRGAPTARRLTFKLRQGVKWHDGKPFTAKDVDCTFDLLPASRGQAPAQPAQGLVRQRRERRRPTAISTSPSISRRRNPRCWPCSPRATRRSIPATCRPQDMRAKPIGTGPFKFVEFKLNESVKLAQQSRLLEDGPALSRRHRVHHHRQPLDARCCPSWPATST